jgi:hypothetical protein
MPRLTQKVPAYRKHAKGQAIVVLNYKTHYLGTYGSKASRIALRSIDRRMACQRSQAKG